jgi:hypothetical protein
MSAGIKDNGLCLDYQLYSGEGYTKILIVTVKISFFILLLSIKSYDNLQNRNRILSTTLLIFQPKNSNSLLTVGKTHLDVFV